MAWILPLCDFGKVSCQGSTESMPDGRIRTSGLNSVRFGSNLDMSSLRSNKHQNLWNSLVVRVMAWLRPTFHEIRRSVGGRNHHYRLPTLAHLGLPFHRHLDPHVYEVHSGVLAQKILVSAASESFKPCARPFGPFLIKRTCNPWFRGFVHMSLRSCTKHGAHIVEVLGRQA